MSIKTVDELLIMHTTCTEPMTIFVRGYVPPKGRWARLRKAWAVYCGREIAKPVKIVGNVFQQPTTITNEVEGMFPKQDAK